MYKIRAWRIYVFISRILLYLSKGKLTRIFTHTQHFGSLELLEKFTFHSTEANSRNITTSTVTTVVSLSNLFIA